ncbi:MAG: MFS transporter, partial [Pseudomonadota bacterium]
NPLYSLLIAHTNDFLDHDDMAAASGGLVFINGLGAVFGPLVLGALMEGIGPGGFYMFTGVLFAGLGAYALYRMTQRATVAVDETGSYVAMSPAAMTPVAMEIRQEYAIEVDLEGEDEARVA